MNTNNLLSKRTRQLLVLFYLISFSVIVPLLGWFLLHPSQTGAQSVAVSQLTSSVQR